MKVLFSFVLFCAFALLTITVGNTAPEAEWPQWRGPLRNGYRVRPGCSSNGLKKAPL